MIVEMALDSAWRKPAVMRLPAYARRHVRVWMGLTPAYLIILVNFVGYSAGVGGGGRVIAALWSEPRVSLTSLAVFYCIGHLMFEAERRGWVKDI